MSNTVGNPSTNFCNFYADHEFAYALGLWCADGYHRSSSIGLSNINPDLIERFRLFLENIFSGERLRLRIYRPENVVDIINFGIKKISLLFLKKGRYATYHVYVNSRPLLREFKEAKQNQKSFANTEIGWAYVAGRFDGDGTIGKDLRKDIRISYTTQDDAQKDYILLCNLGMKNTKIYRYDSSNTFVIYISRLESAIFVENCLPYSSRLQRLVLGSRRDLSALV